MIISFKHRGLELFFTRESYKGIPAQYGSRIERMLDRLDASKGAEDMDLPGYKFHALKAERLMVSRQTVSDLLHERKSVTAEMAVRIARAVGGSPDSWLHMQQALDIWTAETKFKNNPALAPKVFVSNA